jgi:hypothetical protein
MPGAVQFAVFLFKPSFLFIGEAGTIFRRLSK